MEAFVPTFVVLFVAALLEALLPGQLYPRMRGWALRGALYFVVYLGVATSAPMLWERTLGEHRLLDGSALSTPLGALLGFLLLDLATYAWHRTLHHSDFLFRHFHQTHHSVERIDLASAFVFHPLDMLAFTLVGSLSLVWALGLSAEAAGYANLGFLVVSTLQHTNIRTPHWLGYLVLRPENHALHHRRGVHAYNYGGLAIWDMLGGTYRNNQKVEGEAGYYPGASERLLDLWLGRDVSCEPVADVAVQAERPSVTQLGSH